MIIDKNLNIPIKRIITDNILTCSPNTRLSEVIQLMQKEHLNSIVIVDDHQKPIGLWTIYDNLSLNFTNDIYSIPIKDIMRTLIYCIPMDTPVNDVLQYFYHKKLTWVIITDKYERPYGVLSLSDLSFYQNYDSNLEKKQVVKIMDTSPLILEGTTSLSDAVEALLKLKKNTAIVRYKDNSIGTLSPNNISASIENRMIHEPIEKIATKAYKFLTPLDSLKQAHRLFIDYKLSSIVVLDNRMIVGILNFKSFFQYIGTWHASDISIYSPIDNKSNIFYETDLPPSLIANIIHSFLEGIVITDEDMYIKYVNPSLIYKMGYSKNEILGRKPNLFSANSQPHDFYKELKLKLKKYGFWEGEVWNRKKNGQLYLDLLKIITVKDNNSGKLYYVGYSTDITKLRRQERKISKMAYFDALTNLPNRLLLRDRLTFLINYSKRKNKKFAVLFIDLDDFKLINDSFGHLTGDDILKIIAQRLTKIMRDHDTIARLAGDEFIILLSDVPNNYDISTMLQLIIDTVNEPIKIETQQIRLGCSIGVCYYPIDAVSPEKLIHYADLAMYQAKKQGSNNYYIHNITSIVSNEQVSTSFQLGQILREAIAHKEGFYIEYQPIVDSAKQLTGMEALARWEHNKLGIIPSDQFISIAESIGLINDFSKIFYQLLAKQMNIWIREKKKLVPISVNLSFQQFWNPKLVENFTSAFIENDIPFNLIQIELTESLLFQKEQQIIPILLEIRELGCNILIDDFGTGYSSFSYLYKLPVSAIKIDKSFIQDIGKDSKKNIIISALIKLINELGYDSIAEGVETKEQFNYLTKKSINYIQGYYISKPLSAEIVSQKWL